MGGESQRCQPGGCILAEQHEWVLIFNETVSDTTAPNHFMQAGLGTVVYQLNSTYTGQTYVNGGVAKFGNTATFGPSATPQPINLSGGTLLASASLTLETAVAQTSVPSISDSAVVAWRR